MGGAIGLRAVAGGAAVAIAAQPAPGPTTWQEVVALAATADPLLHALLRHEVHPVSLAPGRIDIRPSPGAPRDLSGRLSLMLEKAQSQDRDMAVMLIDMDFFKSVNDTHGHDTGDAVLREFADRLRRNIRGVDLACTKAAGGRRRAWPSGCGRRWPKRSSPPAMPGR